MRVKVAICAIGFCLVGCLLVVCLLCLFWVCYGWVVSCCLPIVLRFDCWGFMQLLFGVASFVLFGWWIVLNGLIVNDLN